MIDSAASFSSFGWSFDATMEGGPKGFRLEGKACTEEKLVLFKAEKVEELL